jgi:hypothetical protein
VGVFMGVSSSPPPRARGRLAGGNSAQVRTPSADKSVFIFALAFCVIKDEGRR